MFNKRWMHKEVVHTHTMDYYSVIRKNKMLPLAATLMDLEGIMLSEISQRKTNTVWHYFYVEFKKYNN